MNRIDQGSGSEEARETCDGLSTRLAGVMFDEVVTPLARGREERSMAPYFPSWRDDGAASYFVAPGVRRMTEADFEFPGGGSVVGLIDALVAHWTAEGEPELGAAAGFLKPIAAAIRDEAVEDDGSVDIFCYTLF